MLPRLSLRIQLRFSRRLVSFALLVCLGCLTTLGIPLLAPSLSAPAIAQTALPTSDASSLLQQGIERYQAQQFSEAIELWQQALRDTTDPSQQAYIHSNLSLAHQQLGRWQEAETAIAASLSLLNSSPPPAILAKALNTQARLYWFQGQSETALETWQQATEAYIQAGDAAGTAIGLVNQAQALQTLGFSVQAEARLSQARELLQAASPAVQAIGLQTLGTALRRVGKLSEALAVLQESQQIATSANLTTDTTLLELGNTEVGLWNKAIALGQPAQSHQQAAVGFYEAAARQATSPLLKLQAQLNQFSLEVSAGTAIDRTWEQIIPAAIAQLPVSRSRVFAQLKWVKSLTQLQQQSQPDWATLATPLAAAVQEARSLNDAAAESYALGQLGELYEKAGQWTEAQQLTQQAWQKAEAIQSPTIRYRWEWQLGRLRSQQADSKGAIAAYQAAVNSLQAVRKDLLLVSADEQFSFRDEVEPLYRELVELLLTASAGEPSQALLQQTIQQVNALQLAELENFLGCNIAQTVSLTDVAADPATAKLYPMILQNQLAVVLELPGGELRYHATAQPRAATEALLQQLRDDLSSADRTPEAIAGLQTMYQWLIAPFVATLQANSQIQTLVFILDGQLRNIPMAALHDGNQFLITNYAVAIAPRLELFQPTPRPEKLEVFLGGIGEAQTFEQQAFPEIEYLMPELEQIQQITNANAPLLDVAFTEANIETKLSQRNFSAIHLKTHGIFSSDPDSTFIVAYKELITGKDLGRLLQSDRTGAASAVELLVLSACSTAKGDNRAVLGLAGIALQAGARSVVSTLWEAQDYPNTQLMVRFYQELQNPTMSRAQALRSAQLSLIEQGYRTPHVWATYVLVGNWL